MTKAAPRTYERINQVIENGKAQGVIHLVAEDSYINGRTITIDNRKRVNFGSCSYLGLEADSRLKSHAIMAVQRYGTQYSCSRAFVRLPLYEQLEDLLGQIFGHPTVAAPTTTLGHISNIPVLVHKNDAVILDHKVHASVATAVELVRGQGTHIETIRHNNMEQLEARIIKLSNEHRKIWYMADGIYSMFGNFAPLKEMYALLEKYDQFHLYVDDAHGMSWTGKNGSGFALSQIDFHPKMILTTSLNKGFAGGGGALVFPDVKTKNMVLNCGKTLMFSGPLQPALLGACIGSAKIHLSGEIEILQHRLKHKIDYFIKTAQALNLPMVGDFQTPIFFFGVGTPDIAYDICKRMLKKGFYTNVAVYPSVSYYNAGLRTTLTNHHTYEDIRNLLEALSEELDTVLAEAGYSKQKIFNAFKKNGFFVNKKVLPMPSSS